MSGPLDGIRVIDASTILAGPLCAQILGDFGADVIKVEHPSMGDPLRGHGPQKDGHGLMWKVVARNKRCVGLYLGDPEGAEVFRVLASTADVVIENFRPGTLERWGIGYDDLSSDNPGLVMVRITGFGQSGPYASRPGFGTLAEAMSGFAAATGEPDGPPTLPPFGLADSICAMSAASAAMMALYERDAKGTGRGQVADLSILEPIVSALGPAQTIYDQLGVVPQRTGNRSENNAPRNLYRTKDDRWVAISTSADVVARRVMELVGHPEVCDEPWFATGRGRAEHGEILDAFVAEWIAERPMEEVIDSFAAADAAVAPVYDAADLLDDPHARATDMFPAVDDPDLGAIRMQNVLFRLSRTPGAIRHAGRSLGADTDAVLTQAGIAPERIAALRERGVVA